MRCGYRRSSSGFAAFGRASLPTAASIAPAPAIRSGRRVNGAAVRALGARDYRPFQLRAAPRKRAPQAFFKTPEAVSRAARSLQRNKIVILSGRHAARAIDYRRFDRLATGL